MGGSYTMGWWVNVCICFRICCVVIILVFLLLLSRIYIDIFSQFYHLIWNEDKTYKLFFPGFYNPNIGARNETQCLPCRAGASCTVKALSEPDQPCSPGYYCPGGNFLPNQTEYACPPGKYNDFTNATKVSDCIDCIDRFACLVSIGGFKQPNFQP